MAEILIGSDHACRSEENRLALLPPVDGSSPNDSGTSIVNMGDDFDALRGTIATSLAA